MKKILALLLTFVLVFSICSTVAFAAGGKVCYGTSYTNVAYTIRGDKICYGTSYTNVAYTLRSGKICYGTSYTNVAYTFR